MARLLAGALMLVCTPACADNFVAKDGNGVLITKAAKKVGSTLRDQVVMGGDASDTGVPQDATMDPASGGLNVNLVGSLNGAATATNQSTALGYLSTVAGAVSSNLFHVSVDAGNLTLSGGLPVIPQVSGGTTPLAAALTNSKLAVKASPGQLYAWTIGNSNGSPAYVQIFDQASAGVTLGSTAPTLSIFVPAGGSVSNHDVNGVQFATAITVACTTTRSGSTAPASPCDLNLTYK